MHLGPALVPGAISLYALLKTNQYPIMAELDDTKTWPELAIRLYDKLTGRGAQITYEFDDFDLHVPSKVGDDAEHAHWRMNGTLRIRTKENES